MKAIQQLDDVVTQLVKAVHGSVPLADWREATLTARYSPDGSRSAHDFDYERADGSVERGILPGADARNAICRLTAGHWRSTQYLGQPRWTKLIVKVSHGGKFRIAFDYADDDLAGNVARAH